jgi:hypothetical protein
MSVIGAGVELRVWTQGNVQTDLAGWRDGDWVGLCPCPGIGRFPDSEYEVSVDKQTADDVSVHQEEKSVCPAIL